MELYTAQNYLPCYNERYFNNLEKQTEENLVIFFFLSYIKNGQRGCGCTQMLQFSVRHVTVALALPLLDRHLLKVFQIITSFYVA